MPLLQKKLVCSQPPQKHYFPFFWDVPFPFFIFLFLFLQPKKDKNKKYIISKPFLTPRQPARKIAPLHTVCVFKIPQNTIKLGKTSKTNLGPSFDATLDQILDQIVTLQHIWLYIYIYHGSRNDYTINCPTIIDV